MFLGSTVYPRHFVNMLRKAYSFRQKYYLLFFLRSYKYVWTLKSREISIAQTVVVNLFLFLLCHIKISWLCKRDNIHTSNQICKRISEVQRIFPNSWRFKQYVFFEFQISYHFTWKSSDWGNFCLNPIVKDETIRFGPLVSSSAGLSLIHLLTKISGKSILPPKNRLWLVQYSTF